MSKNLRGAAFLLIAALIWGSAFVSQSIGMDYVEPFTFNALRSVVAFIVLIPVTMTFRKISLVSAPLSKNEESALNRRSMVAGFFCGLALSAASGLQQLGISYTTAGKTAFITVLYIIIVPFLSVLLKKPIPRIIWLCAFLSLIGLYLLCIKEDFTLSKGDFYCLLCAFCFSVQILCIDHFTKGRERVDPIMMSLFQFLTVAIVSLMIMFIFETPTFSGIIKAGSSILYAGALSSGVAYTFQILGQRDSNPAVAPLIMSLESVFALIFGYLFLHEVMTVQELIGCALVFLSVILSQLPFPSHTRQRT